MSLAVHRGTMAGLDVNWNITDQLALNANVHRTDGYHSSDNNLPG